jgi:hypothetical protein
MVQLMRWLKKLLSCPCRLEIYFRNGHFGSHFLELHSDNQVAEGPSFTFIHQKYQIKIQSPWHSKQVVSHIPISHA